MPAEPLVVVDWTMEVVEEGWFASPTLEVCEVG